MTLANSDPPPGADFLWPMGLEFAAVGGKAAGSHIPDLFKHSDIMGGLTGERDHGQHQLPYLRGGELVQGIDIGVVKHGDQYR